MKKRNVFIKTAVATALVGFGVSAMAGTVTVTPRTVANEAFGSAITQPTVAAGAIALPMLTYNFNTPAGIVVNDGGSVKVVFTFAGGNTNSTGVFSAVNNVTLTAGIAGFTKTVSSTGTTHTVTLTNNTGANLTIGIGAGVTLQSTVADAKYRVIGVTKGTNVTVSGSALNGSDNLVLEAATTPSAVIAFADAVTAASTASTSINKINLSAVGAIPGTSLVTAAPVSFGGITLSETLGNQVVLDNGALPDADISIATAAAYALSGTFTVGKATGAFTPGMTVGMFTTEACAVPITGVLTQTNAPAGAIVAGTTGMTLAYTGLSRAELMAGVFLCGNYAVPVAAKTVLSEFKPTLAFTYDKATTSYSDEIVAAFNGYELTTNGKTIFVRNLVAPSRDVTGGYQGSVRITNTGTIAAPVTATWIDPDTGLATTSSAVLSFATGAANFPAGATKVFSAKAIEALTGPAPLGLQTQPRLKLTAPTDGLEAQTFILTNATGNFSDVSNAQVAP